MKISLVLVIIFAALATTSTLKNKQSLVADLTENTFDNALTGSNLAIVDFFAPWCPHCQTFGPVFNDVAAKAQKLNLNVFFARVDCNGKNGESLCKKQHVRFLPTVRVFQNGKRLGDYSGDKTLDAVLEFVQKVKSAPNDLKMTMSDSIGQVPSDVTPWHACDTKRH